MSVPRLSLRNLEIRFVSIPLKRPVVSKVGLFDRWPLVLIDLHTEEGIVGRSYLEPYLERSVRCLVPAIRDLAEVRNDG
jgi:mandelate racemase